jgi:hypothetical protein
MLKVPSSSSSKIEQTNASPPLCERYNEPLTDTTPESSEQVLQRLRSTIPVQHVVEAVRLQQRTNVFIAPIYEKSFAHKPGARTLNPTEIAEEKLQGDINKIGELKRTHADGWTIRGVPVEDYYVWVNDFEAVHPEHGWVCGNFEKVILASSEKAYKHFVAGHPCHKWDYQDI